MGSTKQKQLIILAVLLLALAGFVHRAEPTMTVQKERLLHEALEKVPGHPLLSSSEVSREIADFLELDDYIQASYQGAHRPISLYIGYYYSLATLSAAHSPLVCFPGQGWQLQDQTRRTLQLGQERIHYAEMVAQLGDRQELVLYWYQAGHITGPEVYRNKFNAVWNKMSGGSQEHAFVRVTIPFREGGRELARTTGEAFITAFYPAFLTYVALPAVPVTSTPL